MGLIETHLKPVKKTAKLQEQEAKVAVLSNADRAELVAIENRRLSDEHETSTLSRAELRAAFDAIDDFLQTNAAAINNAFPAAAKARMTAKQKARVVMLVAAKRAGVL